MDVGYVVQVVIGVEWWYEDFDFYLICDFVWFVFVFIGVDFDLMVKGL